MSGRRLLVVTTVPVPDERVRDEVVRRAEGEPVEIRVVAPASDVSRLAWLANDEDAARAEAEETAARTAGAVEGAADVADAGVGDSDPVKAVEDALREWPADEVLLLTPPDDDANWLETEAGAEARDRFGIPISHVPIATT